MLNYPFNIFLMFLKYDREMVLIDVLLTPENAWERGYQWVVDLLPAILEGKVRGIEDLEDKQLLENRKGKNKKWCTWVI